MTEQQKVLTISTLNEFVGWLSRNFIAGQRASNARALYMFANKIGTDLENDGNTNYSKFEDENEAEQYLEYIGNMQFIFESEIADNVVWVHNKGTENEYTTVSTYYRITVALTVSSEDDNRFTVYVPAPYKNV